jgi:hypothetical protein
VLPSGDFSTSTVANQTALRGAEPSVVSLLLTAFQVRFPHFEFVARFA